MDNMESMLSMIEPQLALPVIGVVVLAVMVYIFGFQQTQEPSYQHLAVLQSSGKNKNANGVPNKPKNQPAPSPKSTSTKTKEKVVANGNVVHGNNVGKENVKPAQQPTTPKSKKEKNQSNANLKTEDFEDGDWIQAVSRKDKKVRVKKDETKPAAAAVVEEKKKKSSSPQGSKPRTILEEIEFRAKIEQQNTKKDEPKKSIKEAEASVKKAEKLVETPVIAPTEEPKEEPKIVEKTEKKAKEVEAAPIPEPKSKSAADASPKNNVAFDEVGDLWEEAKSRGAKKKRTRKD